MTINWQITLSANYWELAETVIAQYLAAAKTCLDAGFSGEQKLGHPIALLLFASVEAMAHFLRGEEVLVDGKKRRITEGEPFRVLNHPYFAQELTENQLKVLKRAIRNPLVHRGLMARENIVVTVDGSTNIPAIHVEPKFTWIEVNAFYRLVAEAWRQFDKSKIKLAIERGQIPDERRYAE